MQCGGLQGAQAARRTDRDRFRAFAGPKLQRNGRSEAGPLGDDASPVWVLLAALQYPERGVDFRSDLVTEREVGSLLVNLFFVPSMPPWCRFRGKE
jgi:hypothetical protein